MATIDAIEIPKLLFDESAAPATPAATNVAVYAKADGLMYSKDDAGTETLMSTGGASGVPSGTSNPGSPATNDLFFRTDRGLLYYYDGTRWLTVAEYALTLYNSDALQGTTTAPVLGGPADQGANGCYITRIDGWTINGFTTNTTTDYVTYTLSSVVAANTLTTVGSTFNTQGVTSGQSINFSQAIGAVVDANAVRWRLAGVKTASPTGMYINCQLYYRLIG